MDYRLLGPVEVVADEGRRLLLQGGKALGLVALLALDAGRTVSAARLVDGLYRDPPPTVENALQQLVSKLRRTFAGAGATDLLVTRPGGYCLAEPEEAVDALRFEHLVRPPGRRRLRATTPVEYGSPARPWDCGAARRWAGRRSRGSPRVSGRSSPSCATR